MEECAKQAAKRLGLEYEIVKVTDPMKFIDYCLTTSTAVVVRRRERRDFEWWRLDDLGKHVFEGPAIRAYLKGRNDLVSAP
jgi:hypothetical protein